MTENSEGSPAINRIKDILSDSDRPMERRKFENLVVLKCDAKALCL